MSQKERDLFVEGAEFAMDLIESGKRNLKRNWAYDEYNRRYPDEKPGDDKLREALELDGLWIYCKKHCTHHLPNCECDHCKHLRVVRGLLAFAHPPEPAETTGLRVIRAALRPRKEGSA